MKKENEDIEVYDITEMMDIPKEYYSISQPKLNISKEIKERLNEKRLTVRELGEKIGMKHPQVVRVTSCRNYNIDTLLKILDGLGLEILIKKKES